MSEPLIHVDPDWYAKYEFCRDDCDECTRLDKIEMKNMTRQEVMQTAFDRAMRAYEAEGPNCNPEEASRG